MPEPLDENAVRHVARLARLTINDREVDLYREQLARVLDYVSQLNEPDTADVEPSAHPFNLVDVVRKDVPTAGVTVDEALANAPDVINEMFRVPKVLDQEGA